MHLTGTEIQSATAIAAICSIGLSVITFARQGKYQVPWRLAREDIVDANGRVRPVYTLINQGDEIAHLVEVEGSHQAVRVMPNALPRDVVGRSAIRVDVSVAWQAPAPREVVVRWYRKPPRRLRPWRRQRSWTWPI